MRYVMRVDNRIGCYRVDGGALYVRSFDHEACEGLGHLVLTGAPGAALVFENPRQGRAFWERTNTRGKSPMKSLSVELVSTEVANILYRHRGTRLLSRDR